MSIFEKLFLSDETNAISEILKSYKEKWYLVVNYLYFANLISNWIIWNKPLNKEFLEALDTWDFLLPDWIALKLYVKKYFNKDLHNLNWTDFSINFLKHLKNLESFKNEEFCLKKWEILASCTEVQWENFSFLNAKDNFFKLSFNLILYWSQKEVIKKASSFIEEKLWIKVFYFQDWYSEFDFEKLESLDKSKINIFMVWLWTPKQEIWVKNNLENIKKYWLLTLTQWWTFDFWSWDVKRAPKIMISLKLEWLWRVILNPKKNFKKVLNSFWLFWYLLKK
jgi:exopolysaccharide biosynthesis WecB/TagA/CpsF family protein